MNKVTSTVVEVGIYRQQCVFKFRRDQGSLEISKEGRGTGDIRPLNILKNEAF